MSVIVPNYNHERFLLQRLESILKQSYPLFDVFVLDDFSTDNSIEIIENFLIENKRFKLILNKVNSGSTFAQWNKGVSVAKHEFIWIAESDDMADVTMLSKLVQVMENDSSIVLAYCQSNRMNASGEVTGSWLDFTESLDATQFNTDFVMDGKEYISRFLIHRNTIPNASAVLFRKSIFEQAGEALAHLRTNGDWLMWLKMLCFGRVAYVAEPLNYFRYHDRSVIARAHQNTHPGRYIEQYDRTMRKEFATFLKQWHIELSITSYRQNNYYISLDEGNEGLYRLKQKEYLTGWRKVVIASLWPRLQSGFIKKALKLV